MKRALVAMALLAIAVVGCQKKGTSGIPQSESVADITPPPAPQYQPAPQPVAQPVVYDTMQSTAVPGGGTVAGGSYVVKRGDTLYGIARQRYGDGRQWTRIAAANPGLRPETLKAGQTIIIP